MRKSILRLAPIFLVLVLVFALTGAAAAAGKGRFQATLTGAGEVPPVNTEGQGLASFRLGRDGASMDFRLSVADIDHVTQAHIHCGAAGVNGPVVVFLYGFNAAGATVDGLLSSGTFTNADVIPRPDSEACPGGVANFDQLLEKMRSGQTYVNAHTLDFPGGEIRGQIK